MAQQSVEFGILENDVVGLTESQRTAEEIIIGISIVVEPTIEYKNFSFPRYQNYYGKCQLMTGAYVSRDIQLQYLNQELLHWRHPELGILETIGCYFKAYGMADTPPVLLTPNTVLTRERYTSLRFKLRPGTAANITIQWDVLDPKCGGNVLPPAGSQGKPPGASNSGYNPGNRPGAQGGDPEDFSPNDGQPQLPGENPAPEPGGYSPNASWKVAISGKNNPPDCSPFSAIYDSHVQNPEPKFIAEIIGDPAGGTGCGGSVKQLSASYDGVHLSGSDGARAIDLSISGVSYY